MLGAVDEFFPGSGILDEELVQKHVKSDTNPGGMYALQRINTGITDIVGRDNGDRDGGYVLVIDGAALNSVSSIFERNVGWKILIASVGSE